jgi:hypothetical protein
MTDNEPTKTIAEARADLGIGSILNPEEIKQAMIENRQKRIDDMIKTLTSLGYIVTKRAG